ncbi:MAG: hypothetical protein A2445_00475 [Candidatus Jacksonbacteria bacterium RIFOXYC2_FULL_44_29]|nr:MAG: hypothetical protein UW45_C0029G0002 [Parcubacteria group bacterium GW2011_GWC2_44_22]OGY75776.1 MAG: hypothetical protein A2295_03250 [Candidatus Jacksonbacteria bacterium RIFOXYB2_FULL_44_15]OGY76338.1 MAG: hypothetical protein A2240_04210 [Candidatus Jacksonbacteria bacterium RIFOXYA2_FULL_43_12]OGY77975.1 MAG: hypothetical protein A2445_00475 [Candidatus Jacksonbacteria bacterium RIFOXYC2_FULL_44_29]OGY81549.1 MAG: hypothetical protein A2550_00930 [Candidatus Jacksonbacteria bacteri
MPYRRINFYQNGYYHVYNRGNRKSNIFRDKGDYIFFLKKVKEFRDKYQIKIIAYCLMPNHFHLLVEQLGENAVSVFMRDLLHDYAVFFNYKYQVVGRLFQGPFKAKEIKSAGYLLHLTRYIHLNPLDIGVAACDLENYQWSSCPEYIGTRLGTIPDYQDVISGIADYREYLLEAVEFRIKDQLKMLAID